MRSSSGVSQELAKFDRGGMTDVQRVSADLLRHQLETYLEWDRYDDFQFPFEQLGGANVGLVERRSPSRIRCARRGTRRTT